MSRWSGVSLTCPQQVVRVVLVEIGERHDNRTNGKKVKKLAWCTISRVIYENELIRCGKVNEVNATRNEDVTRKPLRWNFALTHER